MIRERSSTEIKIFTHTVIERKLNEGNNILNKASKFLAKPRGRLNKQQRAVQKQSPKESMNKKNIKACQLNNQNTTMHIHGLAGNAAADPMVVFSRRGFCCDCSVPATQCDLRKGFGLSP